MVALQVVCSGKYSQGNACVNFAERYITMCENILSALGGKLRKGDG